MLNFNKILWFLKNYPKLNFYQPRQCIFNKAIERGKIKIVKFLLKDTRVDPSTFYNYAIRIASYSGYTEIVKLLLTDKRVDPSDYDNYAIRKAYYNGHTEIVKLLLQDSKIDLSDYDKCYIIALRPKIVIKG